MPFDRQSILALHMHGQAQLNKRELQISWHIQGPALEQISLPPPASVPQRKDRLWQNTCFECFIKNANSSEYFEFNFSPAGDWNCYYFTDYRRGQLCWWPKDAPSTSLRIDRNKNQLAFSAEIKLPTPIIDAGPPLSLTAILKEHNDKIHYMAAKHPTAKPDFHHRDNFLAWHGKIH